MSEPISWKQSNLRGIIPTFSGRETVIELELKHKLQREYRFPRVRTKNTVESSCFNYISTLNQ